MKTIPLSKGKVATVDDSDFDNANQFKWSLKPGTKGYSDYAHRSIKVDGKWTHISLHRFLMGSPMGMEIDHIDGDGLNNQRSNLRVCTHAQNNRNMKNSNKHGMKGVAFIPNRRAFKKWISKITADGKMITIGYYWTMKDAAFAYNEAAKRLHGEFARLNIIPE